MSDKAKICGLMRVRDGTSVAAAWPPFLGVVFAGGPSAVSPLRVFAGQPVEAILQPCGRNAALSDLDLLGYAAAESDAVLVKARFPGAETEGEVDTTRNLPVHGGRWCP